MRGEEHTNTVKQIQDQIKFHFLQQKQNKASPLSLHYGSGSSHTTRSSSYKTDSHKLNFSTLNRIIHIDPEKRIAIVEPRVTMEQLVKATLVYGLIPPVIPEFKEITVGGAIMGMAGESGSHKWGCFNDICAAFEIVCGDGSLLRATPDVNQDVFYGIAGSYGSLGALVSAEIQLVPAKDFVHLQYRCFSNHRAAIEAFRARLNSSTPPDFLDGIIFSKNLTVLIEGNLRDNRQGLPVFSLKPITSEWYYQHAKGICHSSCYEEVMPLQDYLFRYDLAAFWVGSYLLQLPLLLRFLGQGVLKLWKSERKYNREEIQRFQKLRSPNIFLRTVLRPFMKSEFLWKLQHAAEIWAKDRSIIQDFCIPEAHVADFLEETMDDPGIFPLWLCPIKGTRHPQIFAPHLIPNEHPHDHLINVGMYGLPSYFAPIEQMMRKLEQKANACGGRKVLYSHSYYTQEEFWQIYSKEAYEMLRKKTFAHGIWHEITDKVLSN